MNKLVNRNLTKRFFKEYILSYKWIFIIIGFFFINNTPKSNILIKAKSKNMSINIWDILFGIFGKQYCIMWFFTPIFVALVIEFIITNFSNEILIRIGSRITWIKNTMVNVFFILIVFIVLQIITILITCLNIPFELSWSRMSIYIVPNCIISNFSSPLMAFCCALILFILGMLTYSNILIVSFLYFNKKIKLIFPICILWIQTKMGFDVVYDIPKSLRHILAYMFHSTNMLLSYSLEFSKYGFFISTLILVIINTLLIMVGISKIKRKDLNIGDKK